MPTEERTLHRPRVSSLCCGAVGSLLLKAGPGHDVRLGFLVTPRPPSQGTGTLLQLVLWLAVPTPGKGGEELGKVGVSWFEEAGTWAFGLP